MVSLYGEDEDQQYAARIVGRDPLTDSALIELTDKPDHAAARDQVRRFGTDPAWRLGDGDWQPVRLLAHRQRRRRQRHRPRVRRQRRRTAQRPRDPDRCRHQSRQLGRPAAEPPRRSHRHQHGHLRRPARQGNIGIGFAMPINLVRDILPQLRTGKITRGRIGIQVEEVKPGDVKEMKLKSRDGARVSSLTRAVRRKRRGSSLATSFSRSTAKPVRRSEDLVGDGHGDQTWQHRAAARRARRDRSARSTSPSTSSTRRRERAGQRRQSRSRRPRTHAETSRGFGIRAGQPDARA